MRRKKKPKPDKKFKKNGSEEIKKLIEYGDEMQLKETIKTKKDINKNDNKIRFNLFLDKSVIKIIVVQYCLYIMETFAP